MNKDLVFFILYAIRRPTMKDKTYDIQNTLKSLEKYNEVNLLIQSESKDFDITFANKYNPHLLGLSYITERKDINGMKLYNYIF
ncbi:hypothetical protein HMPREF9094_2178 [Fusobacterium animalis ATCC 51191]|uniref:Phage-Barnase-EndoU-ColicinE5/D-RelE like nuclease 4 domain-containing protein n=3 Tax=Fusobacterium TaxID=848 RepID=F9EQH3_9FUSO|nr:hypothetical protein HMPREF9094_2178 [Fusobacterium animalis ATCC 51191]